ncbi:hypothetical protein [Frankia sp. CiP3]|uniref:hypothetical protein n=1 Tax=Frankia sp. CiP3 TaxID=2880971 RepID=UPI001EF6B5CA|nr:hypothetical protein [Frankia sp. CiP3]
MDIFPPAGNPRRTPHRDEPLAFAQQNHHGDHEVTVKPGADVTDLVDVLGTIPATAIFVEAYGDVDTVLLFRRIPGPNGALSRTPRDGGPDRSNPVTQTIPAGSINRVPAGLPVARSDDALRGVFAEVQLGRHDEPVMDWRAGWTLARSAQS